MSAPPSWQLGRAMTPDPREGKLPGWVRDTLRVLRAATTEAERVRDLARGVVPVEQSDTVLMPLCETPVGLGTGPWVRFHLDADDHIDVKVLDGVARVMGNDSIEMRPVAANSLSLRVGDPADRWTR